MVELFDAKTRREWENSLDKSSEPPSYEELREFLREQLMTQEVLKAAVGGSPGKSNGTGRSARANHVKGRGIDSSRSCPLCRREHFLVFCDQYKRKNPQERREIVSTHQRCWNCLGRHMIGEYSSSKTCNKCAGRHHTSLHETFMSMATVALPAASSGSTPTVHVAREPLAECSTVLFATARVWVVVRAGAWHAVPALVDPGSETSLIAKSLAQRLRLPRTPASVAIFGVGGIQTGFSRGRVAITVTARNGQFSLAVASLVLPALSVYSGVVQSGSRSWPHVGDLELADPDFFARDPVELLLGAPAYASIVQPDLRRGGPLEPIAQRTRLGWILLGAVGAEHIATIVSALQCTSQDDLSTAVRRFWEWEELPRAVLPLSRDE